MLNAAGNNVPALLTARADDPEHRRVIGLSAAPGEDDLAFLRAKQLCQAHADVVDGRPRFASEDMHAAGVAKMFAQVRQHDLQHLRIQGCGCVVVCVNASHQMPAPSEWPIILSRSAPAVFIRVCPASEYTTVLGGTGSSSQTLPPMIEPLPIVTSPRIVAPA